MAETLRIKDVAQKLGVTSQTMRLWCREGKGPQHRRTPGGMVLFDRADVEAWLKSLEAGPALSEVGS